MVYTALHPCLKCGGYVHPTLKSCLMCGKDYTATQMRPNLQMIAAMTNAECRNITEKEFSVAIREFAEARGWLVHMIAISASRQPDGSWRGMGPKGFPDLVMVRAERLIFAELKRQNGSTTPEQRVWLSALNETPVESYLWKPRDAAEVIEALKGT